jgi:hypothetical protein
MRVLAGEPRSDADPELFFRTLIPRRFYVDAPSQLGTADLGRYLRQAWVLCRNDLVTLSHPAMRWHANGADGAEETPADADEA